MTSNEAQLKIDECERQIVSAHSGLKENARSMGVAAAAAAAQKTTRSTLAPLLLCLVGLILFGKSWLLGAALIVGGAYIAYKMHESAQKIQNDVESRQKSLNSTIDNNSNI